MDVVLRFTPRLSLNVVFNWGLSIELFVVGPAEIVLPWCNPLSEIPVLKKSIKICSPEEKEDYMIQHGRLSVKVHLNIAAASSIFVEPELV